MEKGPQKVRLEQKEWEKQSRKRKLENDSEELHREEKVRKKLSRKKQRMENPQKVKEDQNKWQHNARLVDSDMKRLLKFCKRTMHNAIFICIC